MFLIIVMNYGAAYLVSSVASDIGDTWFQLVGDFLHDIKPPTGSQR